MMRRGTSNRHANKAKKSMTPEVKDNNEFAQWIGKWTARIQQRNAQIEHLPPSKTVSVTEQRRPDPEGEGAKC
jgi:hypothetical protein